MTKHAAWFMFTVGFFMTFGAVGSIELSTTDASLYDAIILAVIGLGIMGCGSLGMKQLNDAN